MYVCVRVLDLHCANLCLMYLFCFDMCGVCEYVCVCLMCVYLMCVFGVYLCHVCMFGRCYVVSLCFDV